MNLHETGEPNWLARQKRRSDEIFRRWERARAIEAQNAKARMEAESIAREKATLEAIQAIVSVSEAAAAAEAERAKESAAREAHMIEMTDRLLTLTKWLLAVAAVTLLAAIVTLIVAG